MAKKPTTTSTEDTVHERGYDPQNRPVHLEKQGETWHVWKENTAIEATLEDEAEARELFDELILSARNQ